MNVPEVVPFRLTHNMVDAFGPLGVEGPFRIACEIALRVMRQEKDLIMSVLRPFVYDPLVDWTRSRREEGTVHLSRVQDRLSGLVTESLSNKTKKRKKCLVGHPLSVEGQVNHLVSEATSRDNLVRTGQLTQLLILSLVRLSCTGAGLHTSSSTPLLNSTLRIVISYTSILIPKLFVIS